MKGSFGHVAASKVYSQPYFLIFDNVFTIIFYCESHH
jgi:hypothetical protein